MFTKQGSTDSDLFMDSWIETRQKVLKIAKGAAKVEEMNDD